MENTFTIKLTNNQIISLLYQLNEQDRVSILEEFKDNLHKKRLEKKKYTPLTIQEYNSKLEKGMQDYKEGKVIEHKHLLKEIEEWKNQKN